MQRRHFSILFRHGWAPQHKIWMQQQKLFFVSYLGILWTLTTQPFIWCTLGSPKENVGKKCFFFSINYFGINITSIVWMWRKNEKKLVKLQEQQNRHCIVLLWLYVYKYCTSRDFVCTNIVLFMIVFVQLLY